MKEKTVSIIEFTPALLEIFEWYSQFLKLKLDVETELVGSAAVPMAGKNEIDILVICDDVQKTHNQLKEVLGHEVGPIQNGVGYAKDRRKGIIAEFHVAHKDSVYIKYQRKVVNYLQENDEKREQLEKLKRSLDKKSITEYKDVKNEFMKTLFY